MSVEQLVRDGRVTELPGIGKTLEEKLHTLIETGDTKQAAKLRGQFPSGVIAMMHLPGFGPKRARRLYDELGIDSLEALRGAAERQELRGLRGFGPKAEEKLLEQLAGGLRRQARAPLPALSRAADRRADRRRAARRARRRPRRGGRLAAAQRGCRQGPRHRRHDDRRPGDGADAHGAAAGRIGAGVRRRRRARRPARGAEGRPQGRRARPVRQRAAALHRLQEPQRGAARGDGQARAARVGVRRSRTTRPARRPAARPRRRSTSGSACRGSRPSCARAAASWRPPRRARCPS